MANILFYGSCTLHAANREPVRSCSMIHFPTSCAACPPRVPRIRPLAVEESCHCFANSTSGGPESPTPSPGHRTRQHTMNVTAPLSRRPLGCLKAGLCQSLVRGYATAVAASTTTQSTGALPDHNFCTASRHPPYMSSDLLPTMTNQPILVLQQSGSPISTPKRLAPLSPSSHPPRARRPFLPRA